MKNIINEIIALRQRVALKDVVAIYAVALADVALWASLIATIVYFV